MFRGRYLLWTKGGFRGISCPGVETCCDEKSIVAIVDGLSFPLVVRDYDEKKGRGGSLDVRSSGVSICRVEILRELYYLWITNEERRALLS